MEEVTNRSPTEIVLQPLENILPTLTDGGGKGVGNIRYSLDAILDNVVEAKAAIDSIIDAVGSEKKAVVQLKEFCVKTIVAAAEGRLAVVDYSEKAKSKQTVYAFVGTYWKMIPQQMYFDFCRDVARKMGFDESFYQNPDIMCRVFDHVAFNVSGFRERQVPYGEVWLNMQNGTLEIDSDGSVKLREHRADDFFLYCLDYPYDSNAECTRWEVFLDMVLPEKEAQMVAHQFIGYCFTENLKLEKMLTVYGSGSNGKSVFLDVVEMLLGHENVSNVTLSAATTDDEKRSMLENKLANISHESGRNLDVAVLKQLASGEPTEVRELYKGTHIMRNIPKLFTSYNRLPTSESTHGFFRRWILMPFNVTIPDEMQDHDLTRKLKAELPGILNKVIEALKVLLQEKAFVKSELCDGTLNDYRKTSNSALMFLEEMCEPSETDMLKQKDVYNAYCQYCREEGYQNIYKKKIFRTICEDNGVSISDYQGTTYYNAKLKTLYS